jgi:hypothetical protein
MEGAPSRVIPEVISSVLPFLLQSVLETVVALKTGDVRQNTPWSPDLVGCDRSPLALVVLAESLEKVLGLSNVEDLGMPEGDEHVDKS